MDKTTAPVTAVNPITDEPLGENGLKALQTERDARKKAENEVAELRKSFETLQKEFSDYKDSADAQITALTGERDANSAKLMRMQIAHDKGLPIELVEKLSGTTAEELEASASLIQSHFASAGEEAGQAVSEPAPAPGPRPDLSQGNAAMATGISDDPFVAAIEEALG